MKVYKLKEEIREIREINGEYEYVVVDTKYHFFNITNIVFANIERKGIKMKDLEKVLVEAPFDAISKILMSGIENFNKFITEEEVANIIDCYGMDEIADIVGSAIENWQGNINNIKKNNR